MKRNLVGKIFGIALVFVMVASMFGASPNNISNAASKSDIGDTVSVVGRIYNLTANVTPTGVSGNITINGVTPLAYPNLTTWNGGEVVDLNAVPAGGYRFVNWTGDLSGNTTPVNLTMDCDKSVTANFVPEPPPGIIYVPDDYQTVQEAAEAATIEDVIIYNYDSCTEKANINKKLLTIQSQEGIKLTTLHAENPALLFTIPNEIKVTLMVGEWFWEPKTEFQIGEWVGLTLECEWLRGGSHPAIAEGVTFVISNEANNIIWSKSLSGPIGKGWSSGPGEGWGVGVSWNQKDDKGNTVPPGTYKAGVVFIEPAFNFPNDFSGIIAFEIINGTSVFIHSDQNFGSGSLTIAVGDIDGDNDLDVIIGNGGNKVYCNNGDGTFSLDYTFGIYSRHSKCIKLGDFDGDGDLDLIEGSLGAGPHLQENKDFRLYENDGAGNFTLVKQLIFGSPIYVDGSQFIEVADIDGDNDLDILICLVKSLEIYLNNGGWDFVKSQTISTPYAKDIAIGDIDNDGDLDLIIANSNAPNKVFKNDGSGNFADTGQSLGNSYTYSITLGDIDSDGDPDLIAGNIDAQNKVYLNNGDGIFILSYAFGATRGYSHPVILGDIDNDNDLDMITGGDRTYVYSNDGTGQFVDSGHSLIGTGSLTGDVALADIDSDGDLDLTTVGQENKLYINTLNPPQDVPPETEIIGGPSGTIDYCDVSLVWSGLDDVTLTSNLVYSYRLEGYESIWSDWTPAVTESYYGLASGGYTFKVKARDQAGNIDPTPAERSFTISPNQPPVASFTYYPKDPEAYSAEDPVAGEQITFDASSSTDPDGGEVVVYLWDWDYYYGGFDEYTESPITTFWFPKEGTYKVRLGVIDDKGGANVTEKDIVVAECPSSEDEANILLAALYWPDWLDWRHPIGSWINHKHFVEIDTWLREGRFEGKWQVEPKSKPLDWLKDVEDPDLQWMKELKEVDVIKIFDEQIDPDLAPGLTYEAFALSKIYEEQLVHQACMAPSYLPTGEPLFKYVLSTAWKFGISISVTAVTMLQPQVGLGLYAILLGSETHSLCNTFNEIDKRDWVGALRVYLWHLMYGSPYDLEGAWNDSVIGEKSAAASVEGSIPPGVTEEQKHQILEATRQYFERLWKEYSEQGALTTTGLPDEVRRANRDKLKQLFVEALAKKYYHELASREITRETASPVEVRVYDSQERVTGLVDGEAKEEIPNSVYDAGTKTITVFFPIDSYTREVVGTDEGTYGLEVTSLRDNVTVFTATGIPTSANATHDYTVNWSALSQGEKGVTLQIDTDGDGIFEQTITSDATLQPPIAEANGPYEGNEGSPVMLNASVSYDPDGNITLYEWDFDGDEIYDTNSTSSNITHTWDDDYNGTVTIRVTDDEGLTDTDSAEVTVLNVPPMVEAGPDITAECCVDEIPLNATFTDPGWLDTHAATIDWGDGTVEAGTVDEIEGTVSGSHTYTGCGTFTLTLTVTDDDGGIGVDAATVTVVDTTPPEVKIEVPMEHAALQDGVTLTATASDFCGVAETYFYVREPNGTGIPIGYEDLMATLNSSTGKWECLFDTTLLSDGYYVVLAKAVDNYGNEGWSEVVPFSIRNWAVLELLPASESNKGGRTMPVKFSLRIAETVDPAQPFVYNEELEIRIYDQMKPGSMLQTSLYGDTSRDYRIDSVGEKYITNFKTKKQPATYAVEIWRTSKNFLIGSFTFETVK